MAEEIEKQQEDKTLENSIKSDYQVIQHIFPP